MNPARLLLLALGPEEIDPGLRPWLAAELHAALGIPAHPGPTLPLAAAWLDPVRGRYRSDLIVDELVRRSGPAERRPPDEWVLALTDQDIAPPEREFVFGEATVGGAWAVVSLARLRAPDLGLLRLRALKESLHELGHVAGLEHCSRPDCVLRLSRSVADTDRKPADFCPACRARLLTARRT